MHLCKLRHTYPLNMPALNSGFRAMSVLSSCLALVSPSHASPSRGSSLQEDSVDLGSRLAPANPNDSDGAKVDGLVEEGSNTPGNAAGILGACHLPSEIGARTTKQFTMIMSTSTGMKCHTFPGIVRNLKSASNVRRVRLLNMYTFWKSILLAAQRENPFETAAHTAGTAAAHPSTPHPRT